LRNGRSALVIPFPPIVDLREVSRADLNQVGGKAASLGEISKAGGGVPSGFVVPREYRDQWLEETLDRSFETSIKTCCKQIGAKYYAVRSSSVVEDGMSASWAGQFDTYLGIEQDMVPSRIYACWNSPGSAHATAYAERQGTLTKHWDIAVVVQAMVASDVSGVLFTVDPVTQDERYCSLEAVAGLGELLVQGRVTPQSYVIDRKSGAVIEERAHRQLEAMRLTENGIRQVQLPPKYKIPLTADKIVEVVSIGLKLEEYFGQPQDIEWAYCKGSLFVLQSRPITTLKGS
jgi:phosphoenolpyruvate synthase/pyruvate phosphate dikinase